MNAAQFAQYIEELNTNRIRDEDRREAKQDRFRIIEMHTKATPSCDGSSPKLVRAWLKAIEIARPYFSAGTREIDTHYLIVASLTGSMRSCYKHFQAAQEARNEVTWAQVRTHLQDAYLTADEKEHMRSELEHIKQGAFESCAIFGRRFREAAHQAYATADRNAVVHKLLLDVYLRGLRDKPLVHKLIMESNPATLDEAFDIVAEFIARKERMTRVLKREPEPSNTEEPMEVGAVTAGSYKEQPRLQEVAATSATATSKMEDAMCNMARQVAGLQKEMSRMKAASIAQTNNSAAPTHQGTSHQPPPLAPINQTTRGNTGRQPKYPSHTPEGTIVCYECGSPGHIGRDYDRRRARFAKQQQSGNY